MSTTNQEPQRIIVYHSKADYEMSQFIEQHPEGFLIALGCAVAVPILLWLASVWIERHRQWGGRRRRR